MMILDPYGIRTLPPYLLSSVDAFTRECVIGVMSMTPSELQAELQAELYRQTGRLH